MGKSISRLVLTAFFGGIFGRIVRYILTFVIAVGFGASTLGFFTYGQVVIKASSIFARAGLDNTVQKYISIYESEGADDKVNGLIILSILIPLTLGIIVGGILYYLLSTDAITRHLSVQEGIVLFLPGIPIFSVMMVGAAATRGFKETKYSVYIRDVGQSAVALILVALTAFISAKLFNLVLVYVLSLFVGCGLAVLFLYRLSGPWSFRSLEVDLWEVVSFSLPLLLVSVASYLLWWSDILILGLFVPPEAIGRYQVAFQTSLTFTFLLAAANSLFPSLAAELYHSGQVNELERIYTAITKWITYVTLLGCIYVVVYSDTILSLFGPTYFYARTSLIVLCIAQLIATVTGPVGSLLIMSELERVETANTVAMSLLNVTLNFILIGQYGILGAAIATGVSLGLMNLVRLLQVRYYIGIHPYSTRYWKGLIGVLLATTVIVSGRAVSGPVIPKLLVIGAGSIIVLLAVAWFLGFDDEDRVLLEKVGQEA